MNNKNNVSLIQGNLYKVLPTQTYRDSPIFFYKKVENKRKYDILDKFSSIINPKIIIYLSVGCQYTHEEFMYKVLLDSEIVYASSFYMILEEI